MVDVLAIGGTGTGVCRAGTSVRRILLDGVDLVDTVTVVVGAGCTAAEVATTDACATADSFDLCLAGEDRGALAPEESCDREA